MKPRVSLLVLGLAVVVLFGAVGPAYAQEISFASIPFSFTVDNKVMPAGRYEISVTDAGLGLLTLTPAKGAAMAVPVITRLASTKSDVEPRFVFDKVENTYYLSEVWFPPYDGFMIRDTKQPHTHATVKAQKKGT
ncbi:MAG: hypothetical protein ACM3NQ_13850 [Bacteroidales bacterium]